eukprot:1193562-Prorocentrum_minimum.AAC.6
MTQNDPWMSEGARACPRRCARYCGRDAANTRESIPGVRANRVRQERIYPGCKPIACVER